MNSSSIKTKNIQAVESYLLNHPETTRVEIAKALGLSKMTITNIVNGLIQSGFLEEGDSTVAPGKGRPAKILRRSQKSPKLIALYLSEGTIKISFMDFALRALEENQLSTSGKSKEEILSELTSSLDLIAREHLNDRIIGIGVGTESEIKDGELYNTKNTLGIEDFNLIQYLREHYPLPVQLSPALECAALLENKFGSAKTAKETLFLHLDRHIRSVIFHEGEIFHMRGNTDAEFGHISIDYNGLSCECGNRGCIETYASTGAIEKKLKDITKLRLDFRGFCELQSKKNDSRIDWAFKDMVDKLGAALIGYVNLFHPEMIVIGGEGYFLPDRYLARLEKLLREKSRAEIDREIKVVKPEFKAQGIEIGCALPCIQAFLTK